MHASPFAFVRRDRHRFPFGSALPAALVLVVLLAAPALAQTPESVSPAAASGATPVAAYTFPNEAPAPLAWTQLGPDGVLIARALATADCPTIVIDGVETALALRAPTADDFPGVVCEASIPPGASSASVAGSSLALLPERIERIAVVGDTGCRIESWDGGSDVQACDDPAAWPAAAIAERVAAAQPDLIVHVGDYIYRESPCPAGERACAGSPWGDNAATWEADVFAPLAPALRAAPWIFVRGNHETCQRAGNGWFRYLDPRPLPGECRKVTDPYAVPIGAARLLVDDTAATADVRTTPELNALFAEQLSRLKALAEPGDWLLTHKPVAGGILKLAPSGEPSADAREIAVFNATYEAIDGNALPADIDVVLSGHIHLAQAILFDDAAGRPTQVVAGNSGTKLDPGDTGAYTGAFLRDDRIGLGLIGDGFGWTLLEIADDRVTLTSESLDGPPFFTLVLPAPR